MILVLDNVIDPRNLGACIRSAAVTEVDALIINKHHCSPVEPGVLLTDGYCTGCGYTVREVEQLREHQGKVNILVIRPTQTDGVSL